MTQALGLEWDQWDWKNGLVNGIEFHHTGTVQVLYNVDVQCTRSVYHDHSYSTIHV